MRERMNLNMEDLEMVTGGEVAESEIFHLDLIILVSKMAHRTLDYVLEEMREEGYSQDAQDYVSANWLFEACFNAFFFLWENTTVSIIN